MHPYVRHVLRCFRYADDNQSKLSDEILALEGMSGSKTRHFYNNLLSLEGASYLEIGTWKGSSVCSAMFQNKATVLCMDNWSEFNGPKDDFLKNFYRFKGDNNASFLEADCFAVNVSELPKFNIYLYDGEHTEQSQYNALTHYYDCLDDTFIFVVDDWNCRPAREGTRRAIQDLRLKVLFEKEVRLTQDDSHTPMDIARASWWNGIYIAVLQKTNRAH